MGSLSQPNFDVNLVFFRWRGLPQEQSFRGKFFLWVFHPEADAYGGRVDQKTKLLCFGSLFQTRSEKGEWVPNKLLSVRILPLVRMDSF